MKKEFFKREWFWVAIFFVILLLFFALRNIKFEKEFTFYGCPGKVINYLFNPSFSCGDLEYFVNYNEHIKVITCLAEKYELPELYEKFEEYVGTYVSNKDEQDFINSLKGKDMRFLQEQICFQETF